MRCPSDCRIPEPMHYCWGNEIPGHECMGNLTHQHRPKKGMGGNNPKAKIVAILCAGLHDQLDNNSGRPYEDEVVPSPVGRFWYCIKVADGAHEPPVWIEITDYLNGTSTAGSIISGDVAKSPATVEVERAGEPPLRLADGTQLSPARSFAEWDARLRRANAAWQSRGWEVGDLVVEGVENWEECWQTFGEIGYAEHTVQNFLTVCRVFPPSRRREGLTFSHHAALASLASSEPDAAEKWLVTAEAQNMTVHELRDALRGPVEPAERHECPDCGATHKVKEVTA